MSVIHIRKGRDIKLKGAAEKRIESVPLPSHVALQPSNFHGLKARILAKEGAEVKVGSPVLESKDNTDIKFVSPVSGKISAVNRGAKRALLEIVIESDGKQEAIELDKIPADQLFSLSRDKIIERMLANGVWPTVRQRPFSKIANPVDMPKSIFVHAMSTEPLAMDVDVILEENAEDFQNGLSIIKQLTSGDVHLCFSPQAKSKALTNAKDVVPHRFSGPHPAGNISTHIYHIDPINKGDVVWWLEAQDVVRVGRLFTEGRYSPEHYVAITGEIDKRFYAKTIVGSSLASLLESGPKEEYRYISGSVLAGSNVGAKGFVGYYDSQITIIREGGDRRLLGWMVPGFGSYTFSRTFTSAMLPQSEVSLDADENGSHRAIVLNTWYDRYVPLDIMTYFLLRAVISGDIEEAERLGILECDEEDFALATFCCPSKTDVGGIIREGLELIEREG